MLIFKNKKMKNLKYILILITIITSSGCDGYLDIEPKGRIILSKVSEYNSIFYDDNLTAFYPEYSSYITDERWPYKESHMTDNPNPVLRANFFWDESADRASFYSIDGNYNKSYQRIARYNIMIEEVPSAEGTEIEKRETIAQAKILRAYNHFVLVNVYATQYDSNTAASDRGIILVDEFDIEANLSQSTVQEAYDFILSDINEALNDLPDSPESTLHPGKAFGYAFLAKVNLFMQNFPAALEAAEKSLTYNDFIFDMVAYQEAPYTIGLEMAENIYFAFGQTPFEPLISALSPTSFSRYGEGDARITSFYVKFPWVTADTKIWWNFDWGFNIAGVRTPEVYLMKAECLAREGDIDGAMDIVNTIRQNRIVPEFYEDLTASTSKEAVLKVIDERSNELTWSFNRLWDMRRLNAEEEYAKTYTKVFQEVTYSINPGSHLYIMPFATEVMNRNSNLIQNTK